MNETYHPPNPAERQIWDQVVDADRADGGFWRHDEVRVEAGEWVLTFDQGTIPGRYWSHLYTRIRAPYANRDGFRFCIHPVKHRFLSNVGKLLGLQDVEVGYPEFDDRFIVKGNDEEQLRALFANAELRRMISAQPSFRLQVKNDEGWSRPRFPDGVDELVFITLRWVVRIEEIKELYDLFAETLDQMCRIGSASGDDPNFVL